MNWPTALAALRPLGRIAAGQTVLVFDDNGNLVSEAGPHPSLSGDITGLCAALTP